MLKFHDYGDMEKQIHVPDALKARVLQAARASKGQNPRLEMAQAAPRKKAGRYSRGFSFAQKAAVIAVLLLALPLTVYAAVKYIGLADYFKEFGMKDTSGIEALVETFPSEAAVTPTQPASTEDGALVPPEFSVLEAVCDSNALYMVFQIKPRDDRYLLVPGELGINEDVSYMQIPGVSGCTIEEYAEQQGKEILLVSAWPDDQNEYGVSGGKNSRCTPDGTVYSYYTGENHSDQKEFSLGVDCHYMTLDRTVDERPSFDVTIKDRSSSNQVAEFTRFEETGLGFILHSVTIEETELGLYARFTYTSTDGDGYGFSLMDANGEYLMPLPSGGGPMYEDNGDGTYTSTDAVQKPETLEGLQFRVIRGSDFEKFGPFHMMQ